MSVSALHLQNLYMQMERTPSFSFMEGGLMVSILAYIAVAGITVLGICHCTKFLLFQKGQQNLHQRDANLPLHQTLYNLARSYGHITNWFQQVNSQMASPSPSQF